MLIHFHSHTVCELSLFQTHSFGPLALRDTLANSKWNGANRLAGHARPCPCAYIENKKTANDNIVKVKRVAV